MSKAGEGGEQEITSPVDVNGSIALVATLYFDTNVHNAVRSPDSGQIKLIAEQLIASESIIELHGHTDKQGDKATNITLSRDRAEYVKNLLVESGVASERIIIKAHDYSRPAVQEVDEKSRSKNRRVEVMIRKPKGSIAP